MHADGMKDVCLTSLFFSLALPVLRLDSAIRGWMSSRKGCCVVVCISPGIFDGSQRQTQQVATVYSVPSRKLLLQPRPVSVQTSTWKKKIIIKWRCLIVNWQSCFSLKQGQPNECSCVTAFMQANNKAVFARLQTCIISLCLFRFFFTLSHTMPAYQ